MQGLDVKSPLSSIRRQPEKTIDASEHTLSLPVARSTRQTVSAVFWFLAVLLLVYASRFSGIWIYDDEPNILNNENIHIDQIDVSSSRR